MIMGNITLHFDQLMFIWSNTYGFYWDITTFRYNSSLINGFEAAEKLGDTTYEKCYSIEFRELLSQISLSLFSCSVVSNSLWPHGLQHPMLPCPSLSPEIFSNSCSLSWWCHPTIFWSSVLCPLLLLPSIFPSITVFFNESASHVRCPKYWSSRITLLVYNFTCKESEKQVQ